MSMRILHVLDHSAPLHSGYTFRTLAILEQQRALGWETAHVTSTKQTGATQPREEASGFTFHRTLPAPRALDRLPWLAPLGVIDSLARRLDEVVDEVKPDILHAHSPCLNGVAALRVGRRRGLPVLYELRALWEDGSVSHGHSRAGGPRYRLTRALETYVLRRVDAVATICEGLRGEILRRGIGSARVTVVPNAVDVDAFTPGGARDAALAHRLGLGDGRVLGFMGSFYAYEGLDVLVRALPAILRQAPDVRLLLVGGGFEEARLRAQAARSGYGDRIVFTGRIAHEDIGRYYDLTDVCVYPRLASRLTDLVTPLKPLEAMAQGRLVVGSDVGGHRELIQHGETGLMFRAGDPDSLARTVLGALADGERAATIRGSARAWVKRERTWAASVARYANAYAALVAGSASATRPRRPGATRTRADASREGVR
jgi:PEP-CTERM/exosortase A-associated glycosyltransferase